ncbi:hypothetical protein [Azoarcus taiwanensis]|uniref:DUF3304 domain-containing protein n=1 Tax=Azoarcus taiwanensis TaxID=666964 RepID=A0A972F8F1_9RHOO|nr:hypothetical protein [Azoarcus taiwanensis]NMG03988.1 hypothetical protein [Azoarcus taiwanensis]
MAWIVLIVFYPLVAACAGTSKPDTDREMRGMGFVVVYELAGTATPKEGVAAISDTGYRLFGPSILNHQNGGVNTIGGGSKISFPRWVDVTWREGTTPGSRWETGTVVGNYRIDVLSRIPREVFDYAKKHGALRLQFRIKDDGVLFAWDVQISGGGRFYYAMHGGDFPCDPLPHLPHPVCTTGPLEEAPWFNPNWVGGKR